MKRIVAFMFLITFCFQDVAAQKLQNFYKKYIKSQDVFSYLNFQNKLPEKLLIDTSKLFSTNEKVENDIYGLQNRKKYAEYLFQTKQYNLSAIEYKNISDIDHSPLFCLKLTESLIGNHEFEKAKMYCDTLSNTFPLRAFNIKACLYLMTDDYESFDKLDKTDLVPTIMILRDLPFRYKKVSTATFMSAVVPGLGMMYSGYYPEGIATLLATVYDMFHILNGIDKYGAKDIYPIISINLGAFFYVRNLIKTIKLTNKRNNDLKNIRNEQIIDYMFNTLF